MQERRKAVEDGDDGDPDSPGRDEGWNDGLAVVAGGEEKVDSTKREAGIFPVVGPRVDRGGEAGVEDELVESLKAFDNSNSISWQIIALSDNEFAAINTYDSIEERSDDVVTGLTWLDSISHLLELYDDSRTKAFSGIIVAASEA